MTERGVMRRALSSGRPALLCLGAQTMPSAFSMPCNAILARSGLTTPPEAELWGATFAAVFDVIFQITCFKPLLDEFPSGKVSKLTE